MILSTEDRIMILAAALGAVSCTLLVMLCKMCPWCPLYKWCPLRAKYRRQEEEEEWENVKKRAEYQELIYYGPGNGNLPTVKASLINNGCQSGADTSRSHSTPGGSPRGSPTRTSPHRSRSVPKPPPHLYLATQQPRGRFQYESSLSVASGTETTASPVGTPKKLLSFFDYSTTEDENNAKHSELDFSLKFEPEQEKLGILVKCARNLPTSLFGTPKDCFLRILLVRDLKKGWGRKNSSLSVQDLAKPDSVFDSSEFQSQMVRKNRNPVFNEYFAAELKEKDKKYSVLKFAVCSVDRFGTHRDFS